MSDFNLKKPPMDSFFAETQRAFKEAGMASSLKPSPENRSLPSGNNPKEKNQTSSSSFDLFAVQNNETSNDINKIVSSNSSFPYGFENPSKESSEPLQEELSDNDDFLRQFSVTSNLRNEKTRNETVDDLTAQSPSASNNKDQELAKFKQKVLQTPVNVKEPINRAPINYSPTPLDDLYIDNPTFDKSVDHNDKDESFGSLSKDKKEKAQKSIFPLSFQKNIEEAAIHDSESRQGSKGDNDSEDFEIVQVQKNQQPATNQLNKIAILDATDLGLFKKPKLASRSQNRFLLTKSKSKSHGTSYSKSPQYSDKFLEPLLSSLNALQIEKNRIKAEYQALNVKFSEVSNQLEKSVSTNTELKLRLATLKSTQNLLSEGISGLKTTFNKEYLEKLVTLKSQITDIKLGSEQVQNSLKKEQNRVELMGSSLIDIKSKQLDIEVLKAAKDNLDVQLKSQIEKSEFLQQSVDAYKESIVPTIKGVNEELKLLLNEKINPISASIQGLDVKQQSVIEHQTQLLETISEGHFKNDKFWDEISTKLDKLNCTILESFKDAIVEKIENILEIKFDSNSQINRECQDQLANQLKDFISELVDTHQTNIITQFTAIIDENIVNKEIGSLKDQLSKEMEEKQNLNVELTTIKKTKEAAESKIDELIKQKDATIADYEKEKEKSSKLEIELNEAKSKEDSAMIYQMREKKLCMEFEMEKNNLKKSTTTRIRDLNDEIERLCQEIKQMKELHAKETVDHQTQIESLQTKLATIEVENSQNNDKIKGLEEQIRKYEDEFEVAYYKQLLIKGDTSGSVEGTSTTKKEGDIFELVSQETIIDGEFEKPMVPTVPKEALLFDITSKVNNNGEVFEEQTPSKKRKKKSEEPPCTPVHQITRNNLANRFLITPQVPKEGIRNEVFYESRNEGGSKRARTRRTTAVKNNKRK